MPFHTRLNNHDYTRKGDPFAYYGVHGMQYYGAKQAKVYHGGIDDWKAAGKPVTKEETWRDHCDIPIWHDAIMGRMN